MKLLITLTLVALVAVSLSACGSLDTHQYATASTVVAHEPRPGEYVFTQRDTAWTFGPTREQAARFGRMDSLGAAYQGAHK